MHKKATYFSTNKEENIIIYGCGNVLFGDDGFGTEVANTLMAEYIFPDNVLIFDAGTSVRSLLFDLLLSETIRKKIKQILIIDACNMGFLPGTIADITTSFIEQTKVTDFSLHQFPSINLLNEIKDNTGIEIEIFAVQPDKIPDEVSQGLSSDVKKSVKPMCEKIIKFLKNTYCIDFNIEKEAA